MTEDALAEDTAAFEDTTQDCLAIQAKAAEFKNPTKSLSEELEALAKVKAVISENTGDTEYRDNRSVLSSRGSLASLGEKKVLLPKASIQSNWRSSHLMLLPRCTPRREKQRKVNHHTKSHVAATS